MKKKLIGLALLVGAVAAATKFVAAKKSEWQGLTESEVRHKVETSIPSRVPEGKRTDVADRVVAKMRDRGVLADENKQEPDPDLHDSSATGDAPTESEPPAAEDT